MRPNVPCLIVDPCNTVHALHFIGVETVPAQNVGVVVPVRGYFIYGQKTFCAVGDGGEQEHRSAESFGHGVRAYDLPRA